jgi:hypothetical protein
MNEIQQEEASTMKMTDQELREIAANPYERIRPATQQKLIDVLQSLRDDMCVYHGKITIEYTFDRSADKSSLELLLHKDSEFGYPPGQGPQIQ